MSNDSYCCCFVTNNVRDLIGHKQPMWRSKCEESSVFHIEDLVSLLLMVVQIRDEDETLGEEMVSSLRQEDKR